MGEQIEAAEDLLHVVSHIPRLQDIASFRSVRLGFQAGNLTLSIQEVDMHVRPLSAEGVPCAAVHRASLPEHALTEALLVQDLHVHGQSILRAES